MKPQPETTCTMGGSRIWHVGDYERHRSCNAVRMADHLIVGVYFKWDNRYIKKATLISQAHQLMATTVAQ